MARHPRFAAHSLVLTGAIMGILAGCNSFPAPAPEAIGQQTPEVSRKLVVDVDPMRGAAFERATRDVLATSVTGTLRLQADFTSVSHDASTNRTTVRMQLTNAGDALTYLKCLASGDRRIISPAWGFNATVTQPGATQTVDLVFDNPGGGGFTVNLTFQGIMARSAGLPVGPGGTGSPAPTPTAAPTATPTATPSAAPTAAPTSAPTATPAPTGTLSASASDSYGALTPNRAIDGDLGTQWSNGTYQPREAHLTLDLGSVRSVSSVSTKVRPFSTGAYYRIETSADGTTFNEATGPLRNTSWNLEPKALGSGTLARYVRLRFFNDMSSPEARFSVFEAQVSASGGGGATPAPTPAPTATPAPAPTAPPATGSMFRTFEADAAGGDPSDWVDPRDEGYSYSWMPPVTWKVTTHDNSKQYMHDGLSNQAWLSFRRYRGTALGTTNGQLPARYFSELEVTPIKSYTYAPTGDQGTQFYYLDPTHYVELLIKPNLFEVWVANGAEPFQGANWQRLHYTNVNTAAGQKRRLGVEIDTATRTLKAYLDGQLMTTVTHSMLTNQPHYFALRGAGNIVVHDNIKIEPR